MKIKFNKSHGGVASFTRGVYTSNCHIKDLTFRTGVTYKIKFKRFKQAWKKLFSLGGIKL